MSNGKNKAPLSFHEGVVRLVVKARNPEQVESLSKQAHEMCGRILRSFATNANVRDLIKEFQTVLRYFSTLAYWRGYKTAKQHYGTLNSVPRPPHGRENVHLAIQRMLEEDPKMSAGEICKRLDKKGLSDSFYPTKGKQKIINVGPHQKHSWADVYKDGFVKGMISRIRTRLRDERRAKAWMALSEKAFAKEQNPR